MSTSTGSGRGTHRMLAAAGPPPAPGPDGAAPGYDPRRTQVALGLLVLLPFLLAAAFLVGGDDGESDSGAPALVDLATSGAGNFTLFTLFASAGFLLVVVVALFAGDAVASEASWSSLRYLLAAPVDRARLLRSKLAAALVSCAAALVLLPATAYVVGGVVWGFDPVRSPVGGAFTQGESLARIGGVVAYLALTLLFTASLAFLLSVLTDAPLGAVGGAVLLVIVSSVLDAVTALGDLRNALPTHYSFAWTDLLLPTVSYDEMARGVLWTLGYSAVLLAVAFRRFGRKDIVS